MGCNPGKTKIEPDYSSYYKYFSKRTGQGKYILQRLSPSDLKRGFLEFFLKILKIKKFRSLF